MKTALAILAIIAGIVVAWSCFASRDPCDTEESKQYLDKLWEHHQPIVEADRSTQNLWDAQLSVDEVFDRFAEAHATIVVHADRIKSIRPPGVFTDVHVEYIGYAQAMIDMTGVEQSALVRYLSPQPTLAAPFLEAAFAARELARMHLEWGEVAIDDACG